MSEPGCWVGFPVSCMNLLKKGDLKMAFIIVEDNSPLKLPFCSTIYDRTAKHRI
jgi:hypothetical protein